MTTSESKGRLFYKTNRFESIRITNRIDSIRIANWNALPVGACWPERRASRWRPASRRTRWWRCAGGEWTRWRRSRAGWRRPTRTWCTRRPTAARPSPVQRTRPLYSNHQWLIQGGCPGCPDTRPFVWAPFLKRTYFENMPLRFLAEQGASWTRSRKYRKGFDIALDVVRPPGANYFF